MRLQKREHIIHEVAFIPADHAWSSAAAGAIIAAAAATAATAAAFGVTDSPAHMPLLRFPPACTLPPESVADAKPAPAMPLLPLLLLLLLLPWQSLITIAAAAAITAAAAGLLCFCGFFLP
jgi:hypothetical protein